MPKHIDYQVGQDVFLEPTENLAGGWDGEPHIGTVESVKRQYVYIKVKNRFQDTIKVPKNSNRFYDVNGCWGYLVHESQEEFDHAQERKVLLKRIKSTFEWTGKGRDLSYEALKKIDEIISSELTASSKN